MIYLRALEPEDLDFIYTLENESTTSISAATNVPISRYTVKRYLESTSNDIFIDQELRLVIENEAHQSIGVIDLTNFNPQHARAELGLNILKVYQNKHYGTEAVQALEMYAKEHCLHQIYCIIAGNNHPTLHLFTKLKYTDAVLLSDWLNTPTGYIEAHLFTKIL